MKCASQIQIQSRFAPKINQEMNQMCVEMDYKFVVRFDRTSTIELSKQNQKFVLSLLQFGKHFFLFNNF